MDSASARKLKLARVEPESPSAGTTEVARHGDCEMKSQKRKISSFNWTLVTAMIVRCCRIWRNIVYAPGSRVMQPAELLSPPWVNLKRVPPKRNGALHVGVR